MLATRAATRATVSRKASDPLALRAPLGARGLSSAGRLEQAVLGDHIHGEGLVSDRVEQDDHLLALVALHQPLAPGRVRDAAVEGKRLVGVVLRDHDAGIAVVAVAARSVDLLAEVVEQVLAPAVQHLSVAAHHVNARALVLVMPLIRRGRRGGQGPQILPSLAARDRDPPVRTDSDRADLLQAAERGAYFRR